MGKKKCHSTVQYKGGFLCNRWKSGGRKTKPKHNGENNNIAESLNVPSSCIIMFLLNVIAIFVELVNQ